MLLNIFTDGGSRGNPGHAATGYIVKDQDNNLILKGGQYIGIATNNVAEYQAVIDALNAILEFSKKGDEKKTLNLKLINKINIYVDSQLVVKQLNGIFKIKKTNLYEKVFKIRQCENQLPPINYHQIPRGQNHEADFMVNKALNERLN